MLQERKPSPEKGESQKKHIPTIKAPSQSSANQIRIVPSVPRALRKRSGAQEVTPEVLTSPVQQPKIDRFKIIPPKPKSSPRIENLRPEVKPPEVKPPEVEEPEMETDSEETVVTIEVNLDSVDENEAQDSDSLEENDQKVFIGCHVLFTTKLPEIYSHQMISMLIKLFTPMSYSEIGLRFCQCIPHLNRKS